MLNMKKSQARFLSPIGNEPAASSGMGMGGAAAFNIHKQPSSIIEKYPATAKGDPNSIVMPRPRNESKNNQLFDSYLNRQQHQAAQHSHRKVSIEMPSSMGPGSSAKASAALSIENQGGGYDFALPKLGGGASQHVTNSSNKQGLNGSGAGSMAPPIGAMSGGRNNMQASNFSSQNRRAEPARASISDSDFDF